MPDAPAPRGRCEPISIGRVLIGKLPVSTSTHTRSSPERTQNVAVRAGDLQVRGSFEIPYERVAEVCAKYPDRFSGLAGVPWTDAMIAMSWKHENVFIGVDAYAPKHWPKQLVNYLNTYGRHKVLFGTDWPVVDPERAAREPHKAALICEDRSLSFAQLVDRIDRVAQMAIGLGLAKGDRAAIIAENCLEYIEIVDGMAEAGVATAMVNPKQTAIEIGFILNDCGARVAFVTRRSEVLVRAADCPLLERIVVIGDAYKDLLLRSRGGAVPWVGEWDAFSLPYTSGTTGKPRGVVLPHRSRVLVAFCMASEYGCYGPDDRFLAITPLFHGAGFSFAHASVFFGGTCEILTTDCSMSSMAPPKAASSATFARRTSFASSNAGVIRS